MNYNPEENGWVSDLVLENLDAIGHDWPVF